MAIGSQTIYAYYEQQISQPTRIYSDGHYLMQGNHKARWDTYFPYYWHRFNNEPEVEARQRFPDVPEQPDISGFERESYNSPK